LVMMREPGEFVLADGVLGRAVESSVTRHRRERRAKRYLHVRWDETVAAAVRLSTDHAMRLWLVIRLQTTLEKPEDGWIKPRRQLLDQMELPHRLRDVIIRLERTGLIEVQRPPNKRALVRLAAPAQTRLDLPPIGGRSVRDVTHATRVLSGFFAGQRS
jgi:hypothetical protein